MITLRQPFSCTYIARPRKCSVNVRSCYFLKLCNPHTSATLADIWRLVGTQQLGSVLSSGSRRDSLHITICTYIVMSFIVRNVICISTKFSACVSASFPGEKPLVPPF